MKTIVICLLLIIGPCLFAAQPADAYQYEIIQLTDNAYYDSDPLINDNGHVVWHANVDGDVEIYYFNGSNNIRLTDNAYHDQSPVINNRNQIAWMGEPVDNYEIFFYENSAITQVTNDSCGSSFCSDYFPRLNNNGLIVWKNRDKILAYDGFTISQIADQAWGSPSPVVNDLGQIVWAQNGDFNNSVVIFYDGFSTIQLTGDTVDADYPAINAEGTIVWRQDDAYGYREIYMYDGLDTIQITDNGYDESAPRINDNGQIVWSVYDGHDTEIFLYSDAQIIQLTDNDINDFNVQINNKGQVVWSGGTGSLAQVFLYDGSQIIQLTDTVYNNWRAQINNNGQVVWWGEDGNDREIFLARPITPDIMIADIISFFDQSVINGDIYGTGSGNSAEQHLNVYRNILEQIAIRIGNSAYDDACGKLTTLDQHSDFIAGNAVPELNVMIAELTESLECI